MPLKTFCLWSAWKHSKTDLEMAASAAADDDDDMALLL